MPIQVLPPQLANQIAAGEVVERPASVVKELVENSLDAGATKIQIDIEQGGSRLIRIRDNGVGIPKTELSLALARHATSKISCLDDLDGILSLGFRGEALASISSVSRLTLTSRTAEQNEAWQVYAQGREMETTIVPASHPVGTTVEVANLFFNTPARRKFLRTDKTEFSHIDEVIRRIALAKSHLQFTLSHNGKIVRQYKSATTDTQKLKRVAAICGEAFIQHALQINWKHEDLHLSGWIALPQFSRSQNDISYCYINGRMVRDKVISHAIRQAYAEHLSSEQFPAFVLFLDLNPNDVDVNVHPTKHEVRFHQQRLIHDFICQGIRNALHSEQAQLAWQDENQVQEPSPTWQSYSASKPNRAAAGQNIFAPSSQPHDSETKARAESTKLSQNTPHFALSYRQESPSKRERQLYGDLLSVETHQKPSVILPARENVGTNIAKSEPPLANTPFCNTEMNQPYGNVTVAQKPALLEQTHCLRALALIENQALLLQQQQQFYLLSIAKLQQLNIALTLQQQPVIQQPLLIPVVFRLNETQREHWQHQKAFFTQAGFEFTEQTSQQRLTLNKVPSCLRQQNLQQCVLHLLQENHGELTDFLTALCETLSYPSIHVLADAVTLLTATEQRLNTQQTGHLHALLMPIDWQPYLVKL
ncbi:DNA mismatch repair endonuclease MutL [Pasteurella sp. PK-2025]|uniref:DNA mismatch repair endonuclease MutL n=1 Tax=unclassified Pasteurella TaxID=2621516 RepID=UPI003C715458